MAEIIRITDGNAFKLRITGEILLENYREAADMSVVSKLVVNFVRRGRLPQTASVDEQGRIVALNDGSLALGVYGVELTGYYNGEPWRYFSQDVFEIVDENSEANESTGDDVPMYDVTFVVSFGGDSITAAFVEAAISTHNNDEDSHPGITEELSKKVDDIMVDDESVVDVDPETGHRTVNLHKDQLGKVDDVLVNGESVLNEDNEAEITIPEKVSDLPNDADYATKQEAQQMVDDAKIDTVSVDYQEDGGAPDASASFEDGELAFSLKNMKMRFSDLTAADKAELKGDKGDQGDSAVYDPSSPDAPDFVMANTTGQSTTKAMTQKAVTETVMITDGLAHVYEYKNKTLDESGSLVNSTDTNNIVRLFSVKPNETYLVSGYQPSAQTTNTSIVYLDGTGGTLGYERFADTLSSAIIDREVITPDDCKLMYVFGKMNQGGIAVKVSKPIILNTVENTKAITGILDPSDVLGYKFIQKADGEIVTSTANILNACFLNVYDVTPNANYYVTGYQTNVTGSYTALAYYNGSTFISAECFTDYSSACFKDILIHTPENCNKVILLGMHTLGEHYMRKPIDSDNLGNIRSELNKRVPAVETIEPVLTQSGKKISLDGSIGTATSEGAYVAEYEVTEGKIYLLNGWNPSDTGGLVAAYYDILGNFIGGIHPYEKSAACVDLQIEVIPFAKALKVFGTGNTPASLKLCTHYDTYEIPMLHQNPILRKRSGEPLRVLCFGSSWFMNTWWYLNKILGEAWDNCEIHCYYMGHSQFSEWLALYNNDITPFRGAEASRSATKNISVNGSDWSISEYGVSYAAVQFMGDFQADMSAGGWDVIAFQQGARQCVDWENWACYKDIIRMIGAASDDTTIIAFNQTWCPGLDSSILDNDPSTIAGQRSFQLKNWANTKKFMALTGIQRISPCGATMWRMRRDDALNVENDLCEDHTHPDNGLPMYALAMTFYATYFAQKTGVLFSEIEWEPDINTQKALVSGTSWQPMSSSQKSKIKSIIKMSLFDRFYCE